MTIIIKPDQQRHGLETTEDYFLGGTLLVEQMRQGARAGIDAIFLAAASPAKRGEKVLELGSGSGIVALAIASRVPGVEATGVEIDPALCALANKNATRNGFEDRAKFLCGDVTGPAKALTDQGLELESYDHAVANPPFLLTGEIRQSPRHDLQRAHAHDPGDLERWIRSLAAFVKPSGSVTIIHRADALFRLLTLCEGRFGGLIVYPLFPRAGVTASRILIHGRKGSRAPLNLMPGMVLHGEGTSYTKEAEAILRHGLSLDVVPTK